MTAPPTPAAIAALAPTGVLRAAINVANALLVTGRDATGAPTGVSPDVALELGGRLGVDVVLVPYATPGELADDAVHGAWDVGNIGAEPSRAETIEFTSAYCEIECTYLVPPGSPLTTVDDVDAPGRRIASIPRTAYDLWLDRHLRHAELVRADTPAASFESFVALGLDALAGLRPMLQRDAGRLAGSRVLDGSFAAVQQAIGTPRGRDGAGADYLRAFVEDVTAGGFVAARIAAHGVDGLRVASPT